MSENLPALVKDWTRRISKVIHRPPHLAVAAPSEEEARDFLNYLMGGVLLGGDFTPAEEDFSIAVPYDEEPGPRSEAEILEKCELIVGLLPPDLRPSLKRRYSLPIYWPSETIWNQIYRAGRVRPLPSEESSFLEEIYEELPYADSLALAVMCQHPEIKKKGAMECVKNTAFRGAFAGAIPLPAADILLLLPLQIAGVLRIAAIYNHGWNKDRAKELMGVVGGGMVFRTASRNLAKFIPGLGSAIGAGVAYGGTYAILKTAQIYFERGATLDEEERKYLKKVYRRAQKEGKEFFSSKKMKDFRLLQLKYKSGAISKEEFEKRLEKLSREGKD